MRDRYGPPDVVYVTEIETPVPTEDRVLVKVHAASVNRADLDGLRPRWRFTRLFFGLRKPRSGRLGLDVAGVVEAVGPGVTRFKAGDRVYGDMFSFGMGAFAEYVCTRERAFARIPDGMDFETAATLPHSAVLALQGLRLRRSRTVGPRDHVLVEGASGNVGPFAVQIAKAMGAEVTGVCHRDKVEFVRSLGADHVIDYTTTDYTKGRERYDWIVAVDAHHGFLGVARALKPGGVFLAMGGSGWWLLPALLVAPILGRLTGKWLGLMLWWRPFQAAGEDVARIEALIAEGSVTPRIDRRYPLDEVVRALKDVDEGRPRGKVLVIP